MTSIDTINIEPFEYQIMGIRLLSFKVSDKIDDGNPNEMTIFLQYKISFNISENLFELVLKANYRYPNKQEDKVEIEVQNLFKIKDLAKYIGQNNEINIPSHGLVGIVGLSLSHTRAVIATQLIGTPYNNLLIPIANPWDLAREFFGDKIQELK